MTIPRRVDDDRIDTLIGQIGGLAGSFGVVANDISYLKAQGERNAAAIASALARLEHVTADLSASPAGREVIRRLQTDEKKLNVVSNTVDEHDDVLKEMRAERKTMLRVFSAVATLFGLVAGIPSALWYAHLVGWIR